MKRPGKIKMSIESILNITSNNWSWTNESRGYRDTRPLGDLSFTTL